MALEALSSTELFNFIIYDTISAAPPPYTTTHGSPETTIAAFLENVSDPHQQISGPLNCPTSPSMMPQHCSGKASLAVQQGRKKRRRRPRVCKNKEEAETQRMTHIAVERNRRKQMNEHLSVLRSLMPESYVQRGDQASIVGGAIEFVKELEHLLQSLEAQKLQILQQSAVAMTTKSEDQEQDQPEQDHQEQEQEQEEMVGSDQNTSSTSTSSSSSSSSTRPPFSQFFSYPQYTWSQMPNKYTSTSSAAIADIEVTLIETHANMRILCRRSQARLRQLSRLVAGFHTLHLSILHLNVTTMDPLVLYSISAKVEEGCQLTTVDDIAAAVHHMLRIIEEGAALCSSSSLVP